MNTKQQIYLTLVVALASMSGTALFLNSRDNASIITSTQTSAKPQSSPEDENHRLLQSLAKDLAEMHAHIAKLEQQNVANTPAQPLPTTQAPSIAPVENEQTREAAINAQNELLENTLKQQAKDKAWGNGAQTRLSNAYSAATANGVRFIDADCRSSMCKVNMALDQPDKKTELELRKLMEKPAPWPGTRVMHMDRQTGSVTMYVMREGHQLPTVSAENSESSQ